MIGRRACACFTPFIPYTRRKTLIFEGLSLSGTIQGLIKQCGHVEPLFNIKVGRD